MMDAYESTETGTGERRTGMWTATRIRQAAIAAIVGGALSAVYHIRE